MKKIIIILLLSVNLYSSDVTYNDVSEELGKVQISYEKEKTLKSIQNFTKTFHDYLENIYKSLPMQTLKQKEWLENERKRTKHNYKSKLKLQKTYEFELDRTYANLKFYIKELETINKLEDVRTIMYELTSVMNSLRDPYIFEYIQSFVKKGLMSPDSLGVDDSYTIYIDILVNDYFDTVLISYLRKIEFFLDEAFLERNCPKLK